MPLDRRIRIERDMGERNDSGEYVPNWTLIAEVWAQKFAAGSADSETAGGTLVIAARNYTIRWRADINALTPAGLRIVDGDGAIWNVDTLAESDARRRFINISTLREVV